jgi:hypothetical protein
MSITSTSNLTEIYNNQAYFLTDSDRQSLYNMTMTTNVIVGVGLAGFDLTGIYTDCAVSTGNCVTSAYNPFDGYALVGFLYHLASQTNSFGACFLD